MVNEHWPFQIDGRKFFGHRAYGGSVTAYKIRRYEISERTEDQFNPKTRKMAKYVVCTKRPKEFSNQHFCVVDNKAHLYGTLEHIPTSAVVIVVRISTETSQDTISLGGNQYDVVSLPSGIKRIYVKMGENSWEFLGLSIRATLQNFIEDITEEEICFVAAFAI